MEVLILVTTESSKTKAFRLGNLLLKNKLAACVSMKEILSIYEWDNDIEENKEFEITIKSKPEFKENLIDFLHKNSTYKVPQIIYKKYRTETKYYNWLKQTI